MSFTILNRFTGQAECGRRIRRCGGPAAIALAVALIIGASGSMPANAQVPGASYGEGPGATGAAPGVAATGPGRSSSEGPALVEARQLPRTGDGSAVADGFDGTVPVAAVGGIALLGVLAVAFARRLRRSAAP
jgi:hypothetical protein